MSDWLTDERLNEAEQNLRMAYGGRPSAPVIYRLIAQAREANRLREGIKVAIEVAHRREAIDFLRGLLEPNP